VCHETLVDFGQRAFAVAGDQRSHEQRAPDLRSSASCLAIACALPAFMRMRSDPGQGRGLAAILHEVNNIFGQRHS